MLEYYQEFQKHPEFEIFEKSENQLQHCEHVQKYPRNLRNKKGNMYIAST